MASLLLRLFHSDYFSPHLALSYLRTYSDNIGITYYLVSQLETAFPASEVEFYWSQLCHLLITKPSESRALECFILRRCEESVHVALITLWHFQASLYDLSSQPHTASFQICQRVFNRCQRILFDDPLAASSSSPYGARSARPTVEKISPHNSLASVVGIGAVLASVPGMPRLADVSGKIAIEQARKKPDSSDGAFTARTSTEGQEDEDEDLAAKSDGGDSADEDEEGAAQDATSASADSAPARDAPSAVDSVPGVGSSYGRGPQWTRTATMIRAGTMPPLGDGDRVASISSSTLPRSGGRMASPDSGRHAPNPFASFAAGFNEFRDKATAAVGEVFGQAEAGLSHRKGPTETPAWHRQGAHRNPVFAQKAASSKSVPNLVAARGSLSAFSSSAALSSDSQAQKEAILALYDSAARRRLLRSNYCRAQTQFLLSLQDISARLLLLPKPARLSALRAELTALNHKLPAEVCFPVWCTADDKDGSESPAQREVRRKPAQPKRHHRVIRINPGEAVVLNSADRVPYLLHVEVLNNDLDFDPDRRQNRETLKKLVTEEDQRRRKTTSPPDLPADTVAATLFDGRTPGGDGEADGATEVAADVRPDTPHNGTPRIGVAAELAPGIDSRPDTPRQNPSPRPPSTPLPAEDEEEIDLTEQAYGSDLAAFGEEKEPTSSDEEDELAERNKDLDAAAWTYARENGSDGGKTATSNRRKSFSLDEYSERMRTAAVMLSQLNKSTNAAAQPMVNYGPNVSSNAQGGWSSWIVPTSWYGSGGNAASMGEKSDIGQGTAGFKVHLNGGESTRASIAGHERQGQMVGGGGAGGSSRLMHAETEAIRKRIMQEMMALEEERTQRMKAGGKSFGRSRRAKGAAPAPEDEEAVLRAVNKDDPSAAMFRESWAAKKARIRASSPYGHLPSWDVFSVIVKTGADLRQEQLAVQLINEFGRIWKETGSRCWVRYFRILATSESSGLMETITDAVSIHSIKKEAYSRHAGDDKFSNYTLYDHFLSTYGEPSSVKFNKARDRFMESLAAYSIISYLLQIKDRHNGNILLDAEGHLIHIDFGFMLGISPGGVGFEAAPFKMPQEYIDILGGLESPKFEEFKQLMRSGFRDVRKHAERIIMLVELMSKDSKLPCFALGDLTASNLRDRFQLALSQSQCDEYVDKLILSSAGSAFTRLYDMYQRLTEGVL
ncbi:Phosphatidylinositol 4-kinase pik1alpha (PI4-kinase)(PtdIns-4-kinase) [Thecaphora frezii]